MKIHPSTPNEILVYAAKHYKNNNIVITKDFFNDYKQFTMVNKSISRIKNGKNVNYRLLLNQIVILSNLFGVEATVYILIAQNEGKNNNILYPIFTYLGYLNDDLINNSVVLYDKNVVNELRKLEC
jgi:hypothetical protein